MKMTSISLKTIAKNGELEHKALATKGSLIRKTISTKGLIGVLPLNLEKMFPKPSVKLANLSWRL